MAKPKTRGHERRESLAQVVPAQVSFDLLKSAQFRGIHADGVWGGLTPQGLLALTFYSERFPIPKQVTNRLNADGSIGAEIEGARVVRNAIVREAEVCVYMNPQIARAFRDFLSVQLSKIDDLQGSQPIKENDNEPHD